MIVDDINSKIIFEFTKLSAHCVQTFVVKQIKV